MWFDAPIGYISCRKWLK
ncbi:hypothetical protein N9K77_01455 [bacterium]|nr:hypothetical protein [bacterium]